MNVCELTRLNQNFVQHLAKNSVNILMGNHSDSKYEKKLIRSILSGNKEEFQYIVEKYKRLVMHLVFRMVRSEMDREDICQEIFIRIFENLNTFRWESKLSTWIARIVYNHCLNYCGKEKKFCHHASLQDNLKNQNYRSDEPLPDEYAENRERLKRLQLEIEKIPPRYRSILTLYHMDNFSYAEIAEITDLPEGTVKNYLFRAREKLKVLIMGQYQAEEL